MSSGVVTVGRHTYAVGLYWENSPGGGRVSQIAKDAAKQPGQQADFFAIRPGGKSGGVPQFGLCSGDGGQTAGMPALAGCLASQLPGSWAGAFRLNEGVVVIIVRDDLIVPDGDLFFFEEADARDRLIQEMGFGGLQTVYAPEAWSIPGADSIPITLLLNDRADIKLQGVSLSQKAKLGIFAGSLVAVAVIAALIVGGGEVTNIATTGQLPPPPKVFVPKPMPEPVYIRYWEEKPLAIDVIRNCSEGLVKVPTAVQGWKMNKVSCSGVGISVTWTRTKGSTEPPDGAVVDITGKNASKVYRLGSLKNRGREELLSFNEITNRFLRENWPGTLTKAPDDPPPPPPPDWDGEWNPPPAPWQKRAFNMTVSYLPGDLTRIFENLPGAIINNMTAGSGTMSAGWKVEGVIYEERK
ncbi:MAG: type 4b pilus protein PilO2 [Alphaproteobacteria bacterium]|nr:type 4b pilus protein PilO2 [Alphaproteobacteria bacterium]MCL2505480.1 type 4b pilus protein PilO2 [Alphaproteobacteria bacterium]